MSPVKLALALSGLSGLLVFSGQFDTSGTNSDNTSTTSTTSTTDDDGRSSGSREDSGSTSSWSSLTMPSFKLEHHGQLEAARTWIFRFWTMFP